MLSVASLPQDNGWRGIVPLHSTREDIERLIGPSTGPPGVTVTYNTGNERVVVSYRDGCACKKGVSEGWNVPRDTVLILTVHPHAKLLVNSLKLDMTRYQRVPDPHAQRSVYYFSRQDGVRISARTLADGGEDVDSITYEPALKDDHLRCPGSRTLQREEVAGAQLGKFDEYSEMSLEDEKARLDNFPIYLQKDQPESKGYIIVYARRDARVGEAKSRGERAKNYLIKERGIEAERIVAIDGGHRDKLEVALYALPRGMSPPQP